MLVAASFSHHCERHPQQPQAERAAAFAEELRVPPTARGWSNPNPNPVPRGCAGRNVADRESSGTQSPTSTTIHDAAYSVATTRCWVVAHASHLHELQPKRE